VPIVEQDLFLAMGGVAWAFDIRKKRRADGTEIDVHWDDFSPLLIAKPAPFEFDALPRSDAVRRKLAQMWESGKGDDDVEEEEFQEARGKMLAKLERKSSHEEPMLSGEDEDAKSVGGSDTSGPSDGASESSDDQHTEKSW
jgi:hypothetical protein